MKRYAVAVILGAALLLGARQAPPPGAWQYLVVLGAGNGLKPERHQMQLDSLGAQGWELVSVVGLQMGGNTGGVAFYLKRQK